MQTNTIYDCAIIGGGISGLCLAIQLAEKKHSVIVIEKNKYPFHKVCGEYISMESWDFLEKLGIPLSTLNLPIIDTLNISAVNGYKISSKLDLGGFGISRYTIDLLLANLAKAKGVIIIENCKATNVIMQNNSYHITTTTEIFNSKIVCGGYGKLAPSFVSNKNTRSNYIAVKYHIKTNLPANIIELHNFKDGYCGISKVEEDKYCLCYLTTQKNLNKNNNDISLLEKNVLYKNPFLKSYFTESTFLFSKPVTISQISFNKKSTYQNNIFLLGDAAGAIAPLCGNGMSIGIRASKILADLLSDYYLAKITKIQLIEKYNTDWDKAFGFRIKTGYYLQKLFGKNILTLLSLKLLGKWKSLFRLLISKTHGNPI